MEKFQQFISALDRASNFRKNHQAREFNLDWQKGYEEGLRIGIKNENERIIRLLEIDCKQGLSDDLQGCFHQNTIELIKGEQK